MFCGKVKRDGGKSRVGDSVELKETKEEKNKEFQLEFRSTGVCRLSDLLFIHQRWHNVYLFIIGCCYQMYLFSLNVHKSVTHLFINENTRSTDVSIEGFFCYMLIL